MKNQTQIIGRIGQTPEFINFSEKLSILKFPIAISSYYNGKQSTTWIKTEKFITKSAVEKLRPLFSKGNLLKLEGTIRSFAWINTQTGEAQSELILKFERFDVLSYSKKAKE